MNEDQARLLDWLEKQGWAICESCSTFEFEPVNLSKDQILARFEADEAARHEPVEPGAYITTTERQKAVDDLIEARVKAWNQQEAK
jgi:hypothetical protein